jgi:antagonist of KipI
MRHRQGADVASLGLPLGAIQVPANGQPIVLLVDRQPTGGYTVLACVIRADLPLLAQRRPGDTLRFVLTSLPEARAALANQRAALEVSPSEDLVWAALKLAV